MSKLDEWLEKIAQSTILIIGDVIEDITIKGKTNRACSEGVSQIFDVIGMTTTLGGAGNVARVVAPLVKRTILVSASDCNIRYMSNKSITGLCSKDSIDFFPILAQDWYNQKIRFIDENAKLLFRSDICGHENDGISRTLPKSLLKHLEQYINFDEISCVILSDYCKGVLTDGNVGVVIQACQKYGIPIFVDTKKRDLNVFNGATAIKVNEDTWKRPLDYTELTSELVVTNGGKPTLIHTIEAGEKNNTPFFIGVVPSKNFKDAIGAGDVFTAHMGLFYICCQSLPAAVNTATEIASISVEHEGTYIPQTEDIKEKFNTIQIL